MPLASKHYIVRSHICRLQRPNNITLALDGSMFYAVGLVDFDKSAVVNPSRGRFGDLAECLLMGWFGKKVPCSSTCTVPFHSSWALPVPECPAVCPESVFNDCFFCRNTTSECMDSHPVVSFVPRFVWNIYFLWMLEQIANKCSQIVVFLFYIFKRVVVLKHIAIKTEHHAHA